MEGAFFHANGFVNGLFVSVGQSKVCPHTQLTDDIGELNAGTEGNVHLLEMHLVTHHQALYVHLLRFELLHILVQAHAHEKRAHITRGLD